jgi:hypothetical protein
MVVIETFIIRVTMEHTIDGYTQENSRRHRKSQKGPTIVERKFENHERVEMERRKYQMYVHISSKILERKPVGT